MFPFFRLTLIWISGIVAACCYPMAVWPTLGVVLVCLLVYLISIKKLGFLSILGNGIGLFLIFILSYSNTVLHTTLRQPYSLSAWLSNNQPYIAYNQPYIAYDQPYIAYNQPYIAYDQPYIAYDQPYIAYQATVKKEYLTSHGTLASVTHIKSNNDWYCINGLLQLYVSKRCSYKPAKGDTLFIVGKPVPVLRNVPVKSHCSLLYPPFTYRQILQKKKSAFILISQQQKKKWTEMVHDWYGKLLQKEVQEAQAIALIEAVVWGIKKQLPPALRKAYADTGTMHILAISGLHVGMLYGFISKLFTYFLKNRQLLHLSNIFTLITLWLYAWLCNFAPAIVRATTMLTLARVGLYIGRSINSSHGLAIAAFILLLWKPLLLFNWGFQFSYMATLGILFLHPPIQNIITVRNYWLEKIWQSTALSVATQISTFPLIVYYFKQFPLYFIFSNWVAVPAMFMVLMLSLLLMLTSYFPLVPTLIGFVLRKLILIVNIFITWMAGCPLSVVDGFTVNGYSICWLYAMLLATYCFFRYKKPIYSIIVSLCVFFYSLNQIKKNIAAQNICQLICHNNQTLAFTLRDNSRSVSYSDLNAKDDLPYVRFYAGNMLAVWHGKVIWAIHSIPSDWYHWNSGKIMGHYLCIEPKLLKEFDTLAKVCTFQTVVVYGKPTTPLKGCIRSTMKQRGIALIWLQPGSKKIFTWSTHK